MLAPATLQATEPLMHAIWHVGAAEPTALATPQSHVNWG